MTTILCPTRGGPASYPNQDKAIELALQRKAKLIFLYVYNIQFLHSVSGPVMADVEEEMGEMGEFLLAMAQEKAELAGVQSEAYVRHGGYINAVKDVILEKQVDILVMGTASSSEGYTNDVFIKEMITDLQTNTKVEVLLVNNGEIIAEYPTPKTQSTV